MVKSFSFILLLLSLSFLPLTSSGQTEGLVENTDDYLSYDNFIQGNYVVIGAFEYVSNVVRYIEYVKKKGYNARYGYNPSRKLFYVFVSKSGDLEEIRKFRDRIRETEGFGEAWVYSVSSKEEKKISKSIRNAPPIDVPLETIKQAKPTHSPINISSELKYASVGKKITFDDILFYRNSSIVYASSQGHLDRIYAWLISQPNTKVKIHGHTNGKFRGHIYVPARNGSIERFFSLKTGDKINGADEGKLSTERAKTVKDYLVTKGISKNRIGIKGWGKKAMIYPKRSKNADMNRRVEIEVMEN